MSAASPDPLNVSMSKRRDGCRWIVDKLIQLEPMAKQFPRW